MDETLFAGNKSTKGRPRDNNASYVSKEQMANLLGSDSVVMSHAELNRLKVGVTLRVVQIGVRAFVDALCVATLGSRRSEPYPL